MLTLIGESHIRFAVCSSQSGITLIRITLRDANLFFIGHHFGTRFSLTHPQRRLPLHTVLELVVIAIDHIGDHTRPFLKVYQGKDVWKIGHEGERYAIFVYRKRVKLGLTGRLNPLVVIRMALGAIEVGWMIYISTSLALLEEEFVLLGTIPERL
jgi:hypothetical protein